MYCEEQKTSVRVRTFKTCNVLNSHGVVFSYFCESKSA